VLHGLAVDACREASDKAIRLLGEFGGCQPNSSTPHLQTNKSGATLKEAGAAAAISLNHDR
jgi:hypothetical protein